MGMALTAVIAIGVAATRSPENRRYDAMHQLTNRVTQAVPARGASRLEGSGLEAGATKSALAYAMRREGRPIVVPGAAASLGADYEAGGWVRSLRIEAWNANQTAGPAPGRTLAEAVVGKPPTPTRVSLIPRAPAQ
jgi:hypothetical protein